MLYMLGVVLGSAVGAFISIAFINSSRAINRLIISFLNHRDGNQTCKVCLSGLSSCQIKKHKEQSITLAENEVYSISTYPYCRSDIAVSLGEGKWILK